MLKVKEYITKFLLSIILLIWIFHMNSSFAYFEKYEIYKKLWNKILETSYNEYHNYKINEKYKNSQEYRELENLVKIDNVFDVSAKELEKKIALQKNTLISRIREKEPIKTGQKDIDNEIIRLEQKGRYLLLELPWELITIKENEYVYLYKHKIIWNVDVVSKIQSVFNEYRTKDNIINNTNSFKKDLLQVLKDYGIKYIEINGHSIRADIYIGRNLNNKTHQETKFFISKAFTTPFLEENYEVNNPWKIYVWKYLTEDDINYTFNIKDDYRAWSEIYIKSSIFNDIVFLWMLSDKNKIMSWTFQWWKLDLFAYKIEKNIYEYIILVIFLIIWGLVWIFLSHNFISNYRNNFKRIPEEL